MAEEAAAVAAWIKPLCGSDVVCNSESMDNGSDGKTR
jgi:hypothetical protein